MLQARNSLHAPSNAEEEDELLIYNFQPHFTGKHFVHRRGGAALAVAGLGWHAQGFPHARCRAASIHTQQAVAACSSS